MKITIITSLIIIALIGGSLAYAEIPFVKHQIDGVFDGASDAYAIDIDGDGDIDVLGTALYADDVCWWENDGSESFAKHTIDSSFDEAIAVYAIDLDKDGDVDILGTAREADDICWWENDGSENFTKQTIDGDFDGARDIYPIDLDSDGDIDVLGAAELANDICWWENDGTDTGEGSANTFTKHTIDSSFGGAKSVYAIDLDDDGDIDVLGSAGTGDEFAWWENDGTDTGENSADSFTKHSIASVDGAYGVYALDIDGDGDIDVSGGDSNQHRVLWWENDGNESFIQHTIANLHTASSTYGIDMDGDGDIDIGCSTLDWYIGWCENDGNQNFTLHHIAGDNSYAGGPNSIYPVDVDGDGDIDIVAPELFIDDISWWENRLFHISADASGNRKDSFAAQEHVYGKTTGLSLTDDIYPLYVVATNNWTSAEDQLIPERKSGTPTTVEVNSGNIQKSNGDPVDIWVSPPASETAQYDIVVDIGDGDGGGPDGKYDPSVDLLDADLGVDYGFSLPVELSSFTAATTGDGKVTLRWRTESEVNNIGFAVYRSDEKNGQYTKIGWMDGAGNSAMPHEYQFTDKKAEAGKTYFYYLEDVDIAGEKSKSEIIKVVVSPAVTWGGMKRTTLLQNFPNPFNPETWLPYQLARDTHVTIIIYNARGQAVRILNLGNQKAGEYVIRSKAAKWDGRDDLGEEVASGAYFYTLKVGEFSATRKMLIVQ